MGLKPDILMIVCSCNVLSDQQVRSAASTATRRSTSHIYGCLGCSAQCGRCAHTIRKIMDEALDGAKACPTPCALQGAHKHSQS